MSYMTRTLLDEHIPLVSEILIRKRRDFGDALKMSTDSISVTQPQRH